MGRDYQGAKIEASHVRDYLRQHGFEDAEVLSLAPLGADTEGGLKAYGYGKPLLASFQSGGRLHRIVIRTMSPDPFGHRRRADRAYQMVLCFESFNTIDKHVRATDLGAFDLNGQMRSIAEGEFFIVTNYVDGKLYAGDLKVAQHADRATPLDLARARALAEYLARLHAEKVDPTIYARHVRDTFATGEGILGQTDAYPADDPIATPARLHEIELQAMRWRWKTKEYAHRACKTHGDFHPFNILFREGADFSVLDCSRGGMGEAADDVTAMCINYLFFALNARGSFEGALREMWGTFWSTYLEQSKDTEITRLVPLYFTWRCLVVASPIWYPNLPPDVRGTILQFAERLLEGAPFDPMNIDPLLA